jgi:hypothetical protein
MSVQSSSHLVVEHHTLTDHFTLPKLPEPVFSIELPRHEYRIVKTVFVPFDPRTNNEATFNSLHDTLLFIGRHCLFHHGTFNKSLAKMYLPRCRIIGRSKTGGFAQVNFSKRQFDAEFTRVGRELAIRH